MVVTLVKLPHPIASQSRVVILAPAAAVVPAPTITVMVDSTSLGLFQSLNWGFAEAGFRQPIAYRWEASSDLINWQLLPSEPGLSVTVSKAEQGYFRTAGWDWATP